MYLLSNITILGDICSNFGNVILLMLFYQPGFVIETIKLLLCGCCVFQGF